MRLEREENAHQETEVPNHTNNNGEPQIESERQKRSNNEMIDKTLFDTMRQIVESGQQEEAFFLCDQEQLVENFKYWTNKLHNVTPYFGNSNFYINFWLYCTLAVPGKIFLRQLVKFFASNIKLTYPDFT
jgi:hypothetical protein